MRAGFPTLTGVDEAGRGAAAGPLVIAAVILDPRRPVRGLRDSKCLTAEARARLADQVFADAAHVSTVVVDVDEVDDRGVHRANLEGIRRAIARLGQRPEIALIDGYSPAGLTTPGLGVWKGDQVFPSIAAASIVAKHVRDRIMNELDDQWPGYGFARHKGYLTASHRRMLAELGPSPVHRRSFAPIRRLLSSTDVPAGDSVAETDHARCRAIVGPAEGCD